MRLGRAAEKNSGSLPSAARTLACNWRAASLFCASCWLCLKPWAWPPALVLPSTHGAASPRSWRAVWISSGEKTCFRCRNMAGQAVGRQV
ncbi:hypothetical protein D3C78_1686740 [compost metagenome]